MFQAWIGLGSKVMGRIAKWTHCHVWNGCFWAAAHRHKIKFFQPLTSRTFDIKQQTAVFHSICRFRPKRHIDRLSRFGRLCYRSISAQVLAGRRRHLANDSNSRWYVPIARFSLSLQPTRNVCFVHERSKIANNLHWAIFNLFGNFHDSTRHSAPVSGPLCKAKSRCTPFLWCVSIVISTRAKLE